MTGTVLTTPFRPLLHFWGSESDSLYNRPSIGTENPIPEEIDHRKIAVRMPVMSEVKFLHPSKPRKPLKPRSLNVVFLVKKDVRVEGRRTGDDLNHEEINRQNEVGTRPNQTHGNEEKRCIVAFLTEVRPRDEVLFGIVGVMKIDMVAEKHTAHWVMAELVMHQRLPKRHYQMRHDSDHKK
jgi:hypothetical protein